MANMSYCRMYNTYQDLRDCESNFTEITSQDELDSAVSLIQLCQDIVRQFGADSTEEQIKEYLPDIEDDYEEEDED